MTTSIPASAAAAREAARSSDGKFGIQPASESDLELTAEPTVAELQDLRSEIGSSIVDAQGAGDAQADFEASAAYQRATLKMVGTALRASGSTAESLSFQPGEDDPWVLSAATDREGNIVDVGETVPGTDTTWEDVGCALLTARDGSHIDDMAHCSEHSLIVSVDDAAGAPLDEPGPAPRTREAFVAWQRSRTALAQLQEDVDTGAMTDEQYLTAVRTGQRNSVKAAALLLTQEHPEARYLCLEQNVDGERHFDVHSLTNQDGQALAEGYDAAEKSLADGAMHLYDVGYAFVPSDGSYIDDVLAEDVAVSTGERYMAIDLHKAAAMDVENAPARSWYD